MFKYKEIRDHNFEYRLFQWKCDSMLGTHLKDYHYVIKNVITIHFYNFPTKKMKQEHFYITNISIYLSTIQYSNFLFSGYQ